MAFFKRWERDVTQLALMIDLERCTGCKSCEAACKQTNSLGPHTYRNRVLWFTEQAASESDAAPEGVLDFLTVTCQQCERPACVRACPVHPKVISKDPLSGVVSLDESRCTGCGECAISCPYGAIGYDEERHHAVKCDLCADRRSVGKGPACASVCPTRAISFGEREELLARAERAERELLDHDHFLQKPATVYLKRLPKAGNAQRPKPEDGLKLEVPALISDNRSRANLTGQLVNKIYKRESRQVSEAEDTVVPGGCNICFNACPVKYSLRDGQLVNVFGNDDDPVFQGRVCPKAQMTLQLYDSQQRLTQPLKRVGQRGSGAFKPISWRQALDEIADKLSAVRQRHGAKALAIQAGSRTGALNLMGAVPLFAGLWGTPNVASTGPFCDLSKTVSIKMTQGSGMLANVYTPEDIGSAELYLYVGDNQAETRPVNFGLVNDWRITNGAQMVVVDPRLTATASKADRWLAIRPGTDMALGLALIFHLFRQQLADEAFCENWILGWQRWREYVFAQDYSPEWASKVTDISADAIRGLAEDIARADGAMIFTSRGVNQHTNATQTNRVFMFLAAITGNWGRRGGGYFNVSSEPDWVTAQPPAHRAPVTSPAISTNPAGWLDAMLGDDAYPLRALITGNNPLGQWPNQAKVREAVSSLDLVVHMDLFRNATSAYADYVLPMATGIEKGGTTRFAEDRRIVWNDRLIDPPREAVSDHWFWIELGKYFGFDDVLKDDYKDPRVLWDEVIRPSTPAVSGITTERLLERDTRWIRIPFAAGAEQETDTLYQEGTTAFGQPEGKRFPTPSGKLEFWTEHLEAKFCAVGLSALPAFYTEREQLIDLPHLDDGRRAAGVTPQTSPFFQSDVYAHTRTIVEPEKTVRRDVYREFYDMELVTGRPPAPHFHSWTHYFWQAQEMWPELYCQIHPDKARELDVNDGDKLRVETKSGAIEARAWLHRGIRRSAVFVPIGWDEYQPYHPASTVNHLTAIAFDPVSDQANLKAHLCRVSKAQ